MSQKYRVKVQCRKCGRKWTTKAKDTAHPPKHCKYQDCQSTKTDYQYPASSLRGKIRKNVERVET